MCYTSVSSDQWTTITTMAKLIIHFVKSIFPCPCSTCKYLSFYAYFQDKNHLYAPDDNTGNVMGFPKATLKPAPCPKVWFSQLLVISDSLLLLSDSYSCSCSYQNCKKVAELVVEGRFSFSQLLSTTSLDKFLTLTLKAFNNQGPLYLWDHFLPYVPWRALRY